MFNIIRVIIIPMDNNVEDQNGKVKVQVIEAEPEPKPQEKKKKENKTSNAIINNPLGYSVIHEYHKKPKKQGSTEVKRNSNLLRNKQTTYWVPDDASDNCQNCNVEFTFFNSRHHCRLCGGLFCAECTPFRKKIPTTWNHRNETKPVRLCRDCSDQVDLLEPLDVLIQVFSLMVPDLKTLSVMAQVCHSWNNLSHYFLGKMRNIQYKPLNEDFTDLEKQILWVNRNYWIGHSHWVMLFLKSVDYNSYDYRTKQHQDMLRFMMSMNQPPKHSCLNLMCTRNCCQNLLPYHAIILLDHACRKNVCIELEQFILAILKKIDQYELLLYLPFLVSKLTHQKVDSANRWGDFLLDKCFDKSKLAIELYWNLTYNYKQTRHSIYRYYINKLLDTMSDDIIRKINNTFAFVKVMENIPESKDLFELKNYFRRAALEGTVLPLNSDLTVDKPYVPNIRIKYSATSPLLLPLKCHNQDGEDVDFNLIYKFEDVRQDYIVLKAIRLMKYLLKTYENLDLEMVDYEVCPIDGKTGLIEVVPECHTVYEIKKKFSILNYIAEHNPEEKVEVLRKRFVRSCATYCVVTYLLGVGDRHLDNIMITNDGKIFHIDYGFILGSDPKPLSQPKIRITQEMVDALGGFESRNYKEFKVLCNRIYQGLRGHLNLFIVLLSIMTKSDKEYNQVVNLLTSRFMPGETKKSAIVQLESEILRSTQHTNLSELVNDFFHYHAKEHTLQSVLSNTQQATTTVVKGSVDIGKKVGNYLSTWWSPSKEGSSNPKSSGSSGKRSSSR